MNSLRQLLQNRQPRTAIILGSSLGPVADAVADPLVIPYGEIPGFPVSKVSGHAGKLVVGRLGGVEVAVLQGRSHPYESGNPAVMRPAIEMLREAGIETLILTNAAGSLDVKMRAGAIMLITDHINYAGMNPLVGQQGDENFVPMTDAYDPVLRHRMIAAAEFKESHAAPGRLCLVLGAVVRDTRRNPHGADHRGQRCWYVDGAGNHIWPGASG